MNGIRIYGASFLEALAIYACQREPERLWLTLGPREVILKQIVESIQPGLKVQMVPSALICTLHFEPGHAYILSAPLEALKGLSDDYRSGQAGLLVLFCEELPELGRCFQQAGIQTRVLGNTTDLAAEIALEPPAPLPVYLTSPEAAKTAGNLKVGWRLENGLANGPDRYEEKPLSARPRTLVVVPHMPWPLNSGGRIRIFESLEAVSRFADITLLMVYYSYQDLPGLFHLHRRFGDVIAARLARGEVQDERLPRVIAEFTSAYTERAFLDAVERVCPDLVHLHFAYTGACARLAEGIPLLLEEHNVEYDILLRSGLHEDCQSLKRFEQELWRQADHVIAVTQRDRLMMAETVPLEKTSLLPNGVNTRHFRPSSSPGEMKFVFLGGLDYPPNQQAIRNFHDYVWPSLRGRRIPWYIMGSGVPGGLDFIHSDPQIRFLHNVPDVRPYLDSNAIMVVPLLVGGGSRLKVLTALAMGCPVVSTSLGCEGLDVVDGEHVLLADTPEAMLAQVTRLVEDPDLRLDLSRRGRALAERLYDWEIVLQPLQSIYEKLLR